jgi:hypothetical protein
MFIFADYKTGWNRRLGPPSVGFEIFMPQEYGHITGETRRIAGSIAALS